jgi:DNA-binding XRE family transcriptional regulator
MGRNLDDVIESLPSKRQEKIAALSQEKIKEMIAHAATLADFRKAVGKTQAEVAKHLGINQNAVSQLEKRSDTYVSTLRRFLKSMGMTLELSVLDKNGVRIDLPNFLPWSDGTAANSVEAYELAARAPAVKVAAKNSAAEAAPAKKEAPAIKGPVAAKKRTAARAKSVGA